MVNDKHLVQFAMQYLSFALQYLPLASQQILALLSNLSIKLLVIQCSKHLFNSDAFHLKILLIML